jgi:hypothetical protein
MAACVWCMPLGSQTVVPVPYASSVSGMARRRGRAGSASSFLGCGLARHLCSGAIGVADSIGAPACSSCAVRGWRCSRGKTAWLVLHPRSRLSHARSGRIIGSLLPSGSLGMPTPLPLVGSPSRSLGCQRPSRPFSASRRLSKSSRFRKSVPLLGMAGHSEQMLMPSWPHVASVALICYSFCSFFFFGCHPSDVQAPDLGSFRSLSQRETHQNLVAQFVGKAEAITVNWRFTTTDARIKLKRLYPSLETKKPSSPKKPVAKTV